jgi:hypothetical protein
VSDWEEKKIFPNRVSEEPATDKGAANTVVEKITIITVKAMTFFISHPSTTIEIT